MQEEIPDLTHEFASYIDLASERFGGKVLWCTDDFFAEKENLIKPSEPVFIADKYTDRGKWMDGWESRRKRGEGHDSCIIQLGAPGVIKGFNVDTSHFLGNHPPHCSIEACFAPDGLPLPDGQGLSWVEVLKRSPLEPGKKHFFAAQPQPAVAELSTNGVHVVDPAKEQLVLEPGLVAVHNAATHIRLHIYPDGGVARLRVFGEVHKEWDKVSEDELIDLAAAQNGAMAVQCNDMFFSHMNNLLMPGRGVNMGDGWETKRNRNPNNCDWVIVRLAHKGHIQKVLVDTHHFKGNYPDTFTLEGCTSTDDDLSNCDWKTIVPRTKLDADKEHLYEKEIATDEPFTHVSLRIFPDGGVSRLRLWGNIDKS
jgi:allantoicase